MSAYPNEIHISQKLTFLSGNSTKEKCAWGLEGGSETAAYSLKVVLIAQVKGRRGAARGY